jgi:hypothetical protein
MNNKIIITDELKEKLNELEVTVFTLLQEFRESVIPVLEELEADISLIREELGIDDF